MHSQLGHTGRTGLQQAAHTRHGKRASLPRSRLTHTYTYSNAAGSQSTADRSSPAASPQTEAASTSSRDEGAGSRDSSSNQQAQSSGTPSTSAPAKDKDSLPNALLRKLCAAESANAAAEMLLEAQPSTTSPSERCACQIIAGALDRGNLALALSLHDSMCQARGRMVQVAASASFSLAPPRGQEGEAGASGTAESGSSTKQGASSAQFSRSVAGASAEEDEAVFSWPPASISSTSTLVLGLCRQLAITEALETVNRVRTQGLAPTHDAIGFGKVIASPLAPTRTLTVVPPQEGCTIVADAFSKYEYEVFSGDVVSTKSEALQVNNGILYSALRFVGILRRAPPAAVHEFVVQAPDGTSRTFRMATPSADVPAQKGERVTFVCAPGPDKGVTSSGSGSMKGGSQAQRKPRKSLFSPNPPGTKPGEALTATNHRTGAVMSLLPPPLSNQQGLLPGWVLPAALLLSGGDAASSLVDPSLPLLLGVGAASLIGSGVAGNRLLLPRLKQLPDQALSMEYLRQTLLGQYAQLGLKVETVLGECSEDVRVLARLWQLQNKMQSVGSSMSASYGARMERVINARQNIEQRLSKKLELLDGYGRVMNMIEIEVEIDTEVPAAEFQGIAEQMSRLEELEDLQGDWLDQAEARDEVERLLRTL